MRNAAQSKKLFLILFIFISAVLESDAQSLWAPDTVHFFRFSGSIGVGTGYPLQKAAVGLAGAVEITYQLRKQLFSVGANSVSDGKSSEDKADVSNGTGSVFITYGRAVTRNRFFLSVNAGIGFVTTEEKGRQLNLCGCKYEKIEGTATGLALSLKILSITPFSGKGLEFFMNVNNKASFGGINACFQFGKLKKDDSRDTPPINCYDII